MWRIRYALQVLKDDRGIGVVEVILILVGNINYLLRGGYKVYKVKTYEKIELNIQWKAGNVYEVS